MGMKLLKVVLAGGATLLAGLGVLMGIACVLAALEGESEAEAYARQHREAYLAMSGS